MKASRFLRTASGVIGVGQAVVCTTRARGTSEPSVFESDRGGTAVRLPSGETSGTDCTSEKKYKDSLFVHIEKLGSALVEVQVTNDVARVWAAGMTGNGLLGGLIGTAVDADIGATLGLILNPISTKPQPIQTTSRWQNGGVRHD